MIDIKEIIAKSGDSIIRNYSYSKGALSLEIELYDLDIRVKLSVKTDTVNFNEFLENSIIQPLTGMLVLQDLNALLKTQHGIYIPSSDFGKFMQEARKGASLAYGRKESDIKYIFSLVGAGDSILCLIKGLENITIEELASTLD